MIVQFRAKKVGQVAKEIFGFRTARILQEACMQVADITVPFTAVAAGEIVPSTMQIIDTKPLRRCISGLQAHQPDLATNLDGTNGILTNGINGHTDGDTVEDREDDEEVEERLALLSESLFSFVSKSAANQWLIDKAKYNEFLWSREMRRHIGDGLPESALKIIRMVVDRGMLDEKTMQDVGLLNAKELRKCLSELRTRGFLELQEVPKDPQRQPKSTMFFYFYDAERVRRRLLERIYKTMSRIYERLAWEREKLSTLLTKAERTDVRDHERDMLTDYELDTLNEWRQKERWLMTELYRLDRSVILLEPHV
jgi:DNA-directed RNA polymerase III subunit RPC3